MPRLVSWGHVPAWARAILEGIEGELKGLCLSPPGAVVGVGKGTLGDPSPSQP